MVVVADEDDLQSPTCRWCEVARERFVGSRLVVRVYHVLHVVLLGQKIKKSLGPDFLDPTELNSQMKHRIISESLKSMPETEKVHSDETTMHCSKCNQNG